MEENSCKLLDGYKREGGGFEDFKAAALDMHCRTQMIRVMPRDVMLLSLCPIRKLQKPGCACFYILSNNQIIDFVENGERMKLIYVPIDRIGNELYEEMKATTGLMAQVDKRLFVIGSDAFLTLSQVAKVGGPGMKDDSGIIRDLHIAKGFFERKSGVTFVARGADGIGTGKIYSVFCKMHDLNASPMILEALKNPDFISAYKGFTGTEEIKVSSFKVTNRDVEVIIPLGSGKPVNPGIMLCDSDTGYSELSVRQVWILENGSYLIAGEESMQHSNSSTTERYVGDIVSSLKSLSESGFAQTFNDLQASKGEVNIRKFVKESCGNGFPASMANEITDNIKEMLGINKRKQTASLRDVAMMLIDIPGTLSYEKARLANFRKALYESIVKYVSESNGAKAA